MISASPNKTVRVLLLPGTVSYNEFDAEFYIVLFALFFSYTACHSTIPPPSQTAKARLPEGRVMPPKLRPGSLPAAFARRA